MASCVSPPPRYLAFLPVHMLYWRPSFFWRREQRGEGATGQMKECENEEDILPHPEEDEEEYGGQ